MRRKLPNLIGMDPTRQWLTMLAHTHIEVNGASWSPAQWLLDHGHSFGDWSPLPKRLRRGVPRRCFYNSLELAQRGRGRYVYCEGIATGSIIPTDHAWCYDRETGLIVDKTWQLGSYYLGLPIRTKYAASVLRTESLVVLDWEHDFPIMTGVVPVEVWREKLP